MLYRCHIRPYSRKNSGSGNRLHIDSMQHVITYLEVLSMGILWTYQVLYGEIFYSQPPIARTNPGLGTQHHSHIISTCNWGHFTKILDLKNTIQTPPINYSSQFQNKFWHWVEICHVKVEFLKVCGWGFQYAKVQQQIFFQTTTITTGCMSFVIWGIQLGISQLHLGRPRARPGKSSGWKMILSFWDGLFLGAILVSEVIPLNQIGKSRYDRILQRTHTSLRLLILGFSMSSLDISQRKHIWPENESLQKHQEHQDLVSPRKKCAASFQQTNPPFANVTSGVFWNKT